MIWIFDIEAYVNYFMVIFKNVNSKEIKEFIIFEERNDLTALYDFMSDHNKWFVGYNSFSFDNQILKFIHVKYFDFSMTTSNEICMSIHNLVTTIIGGSFRDYMYNLPFRTIDLMKMGGYQKSLKLMGVSMKWPKIQDLPIPIEKIIKLEDVNIIRSYNLNDVLMTEQLYIRLLDRLKLRAEISDLYGIDVYTESDSWMANRILEKFYSEATGLEKKHFKDLRTVRKFIKFDWVIFPEINFQTETLMNLLEEVRDHTYYKDQPFFKKRVKFGGVEYKLGVGGIHSVDNGAVFEYTDTTDLIDCDIASMYPSLAINHNLAPEHLGTKFMKNFREVRDKRIRAKHEGRKAENECLKIVLNSAIGKTLNEHLWLYDPIVNLRVTINGQLYILMLIEQLVLNGFKVISANTDGVTTIVEKNKESLYYDICKKWELETQFELEYAYYKKYVRRDVNNYVAVKTNNKTKVKGIFITEPDLAKGFDKPIVSIALYEYFVNNTPVEKTIREHKDIYDFCIAKKIDNKFTNELHYLKDGKLQKDILQKSVRYYVSTNGAKLFKTEPPPEYANFMHNLEPFYPREDYEVNKLVTIFNNYKEGPYNIDYGYYINSTQKIINEIINPQLTLF
jgi:hypothetical protein